MFIQTNTVRLTVLKSTVYTTRRTKNPAQSFPETRVVDKSARGSMSPTGVCRVNFC